MTAVAACGKGRSDELGSQSGGDEAEDAGPAPNDAAGGGADATPGHSPPSDAAASPPPGEPCSEDGPTLGPSAGSCQATTPITTCPTSNAACAAHKPACPIAASCGSTSTCMPMSDNAGKTALDFRIRHLDLAAPPALTQPFIQSAVFDKNVDLNMASCGQLGSGGLNWLLRLDTTNGTLRSGAGLPSADPYSNGYCFVSSLVTGVPSGTTCLTFPPGRRFASGTIAQLTIPIFINGQTNDALLLPLRDVAFRGRVSGDANCIGAFDPRALDAQCASDPATCSPWPTGGEIEGIITLEDADRSMIADLSESLCVLLTETPKDPTTSRCKRDANGAIAYPGDTCSTGGSCRDALRFAAKFAASAVKIHADPGTPQCE